MDELLSKQKLSLANKQKQAQTNSGGKDKHGAGSQGEITLDHSFQAHGGGKGFLEQIFGSGFLTDKKGQTSQKNNPNRGGTDQQGDPLNDTLLQQRSLEDDDEEPESPTTKVEEPKEMGFGDKLSARHFARTNRHKDEPEELFKMTGDLANNSALRVIAGFADHLKHVENANKNMFSSQFTIKNKTETHPVVTPAARENQLMVVVKPGILPSHLLMLGGIGSDVISNFEAYSFAKKKWEFIMPDLSGLPGATTFKIYGHRGEYFDGNVYFFGGYVSLSHNFSKYLSNELFSFSLDSRELRRIPTSEGGRIPRPRIGHATVVYSNFLVVMGGRGESYNIRSDFWIVGLKLKPAAKTTDKFAFTWAKLDILGISGENDLEFADVCYHTLTHIPKCKEAPGFANHVRSEPHPVIGVRRTKLQPSCSKQSDSDQD